MCSRKWAIPSLWRGCLRRNREEKAYINWIFQTAHFDTKTCCRLFSFYKSGRIVDEEDYKCNESLPGSLTTKTTILFGSSIALYSFLSLLLLTGVARYFTLISFFYRRFFYNIRNCRITHLKYNFMQIRINKVRYQDSYQKKINLWRLSEIMEFLEKLNHSWLQTERF